MNSCMYRGIIYHGRRTPEPHTFRYRADYLFLDLDEIDEVFDLSAFWSVEQINLATFRRMDYLPSDLPLPEVVRDQIKAQTGDDFSGRIFLLATLRGLGYSMNPIALFYCYEGDKLAYVVVEVHNTPWNERHVYVLKGPDFHQESDKAFHVSPFMPMATRYEWKLSDPGESLDVSIGVRQEEQPMFNATMQLKRIPLSSGASGGNVRGLVIRQGFQAIKIISGIYFEALRLWLKNVPFFPHPQKKKLQGS